MPFLKGMGGGSFGGMDNMGNMGGFGARDMGGRMAGEWVYLVLLGKDGFQCDYCKHLEVPELSNKSELYLFFSCVQICTAPEWVEWIVTLATVTCQWTEDLEILLEEWVGDADFRQQQITLWQ